MDISLHFRPGNTVAKIDLHPGDELTAEGGSMVAMSGHVQLETSTRQRGGGGLLKGLKRMLSGESFFLNHYRTEGQGGSVWLATTLPGDMLIHELDGTCLIVQAGSFVACDRHGVEMDMSWQGFKTAFSGESMFWLKMSGRGKAVLSSFGAIYPIQVNGEHIVDTGHIVAFEETLDFKLTKAGKSWISSMLGGEGLVCRFEGRGTVWCQSHNPPSFGRTLGPLLRSR